MQFEIVFRGKFVPGFEEAEVRRNLAKLFRTDEARIARLLAGARDGARTVLKSGLDRATADKYREVLRKAGARVAVVSLRDPASPRVAPQPASPPVQPTEQAPPEAPAETGPGLAEPGAVLAAVKRVPEPEFDLSPYALAEVGVVFDDSPPPPPVDVPTSHLEAADVDLDDPLDSTPHPEPPPFDLGDLDLGDDDTPFDPSPPPPEPEIDISGLDATDVDDPLDTSPRPNAPVIDTSGLALDDG